MTALKPEINQNNIYKISFITNDALSSWQRRLFHAIQGNSWYLWELYATHKIHTEGTMYILLQLEQMVCMSTVRLFDNAVSTAGINQRRVL